MNEQKPPNAIEWTRIRNSDGTIRRGFTWNPIAGCLHGCGWYVNGQLAECYAKTVAEKFTTAYPNKFAHHYWHPNRLEEPLKLKTSAGIFLDSMSDLMGAWVEDEQIEAVLDVCRRAHWHTFQLLTKNAPRLLQFDFPDNVWVGVSSPPDEMFGKTLETWQKTRMLNTALKALTQVQARVTWMSFEPLSWDVSEIVARYPLALGWAVIGAASNGRTLYPPDERHVRSLLAVLDAHRTSVFFKGNLISLPYAAANWREHFPQAVLS